MFGLPIEVLLSFGTGIAGFLMKHVAQTRANNYKLIELGMKQGQKRSDLSDAAAKRSSPFARKLIAFFVVFCVIGGLLWAAGQGIDVNIMGPKEQKSILWGLIKYGDATEVITMSGLVFPVWIKYIMITIISFFFGNGAAKA